MKPFFNSIEKAFNRSKSLLWPFNRSVWLKLFVIFLFSGGCSQGLNFGFPGSTGGSSNQEKTQSTTQDQTESSPEEIPLDVSVEQDLKKAINWGRVMWEEYRFLVLSLLFILFVLLLILFLFLLWISCRVSMMGIQCLATNRVVLKQSWRDMKVGGDSLLYWNVVVLGVPLVIALLLGGIIYGGIKIFELGWVTGIGAGLVGFLFLIGFIGYMVVYWLMGSFLPIVMYGKEDTAWRAMNQLFSWFREHIKKSLLYLFFYILFSMAFTTAVWLCFAFVFLIIVLPFAILFGIFTAIAAKISGIVFAVGVVIAGIVLAVLLFAVFVAGMVPLQTMVTYFRMELVGLVLKNPKNPILTNGM